MNMFLREPPKTRRWTPSAIECYKRGCVCKGCLIQDLMEQKCRMKASVVALVKDLGAPPDDITPLIPGAKDGEIKIINAIADGADTRELIAELLDTSINSVQSLLSNIYALAENNGAFFPNDGKKFDDLVRYIKTLKGDKMYDKDLDLEYSNYFAPVIDCVKKGYTTPKDISERTKIKNSTISVTFINLFNFLADKGLIKDSAEKSKRVAVINFITQRLMDTYEKQKSTTPVSADAQPDEPKTLVNTPLSESENKVFKLLLDGKNYNKCAEILICSQTTIKTHVNNIFTKKNYHSLQELITSEYKNKIKELEQEITVLKSSSPKYDFSAAKEKISAEILNLEEKSSALKNKLERIEAFEKEMEEA